MGFAATGLLALIAFTRVEIDPTPPVNPWMKTAGDIDGDARPDIVVAGSAGPLVWYANPSWKKRVISGEVRDAVDVELGDVDGDGDLDAIGGCIFWCENPGPKGDPAAGPWKTTRITDHRMHDIELGDLDADGRLDVVSRGQSGFGRKEGNQILLLTQRSPASWSRRAIACPDGEGLKLADLNGDRKPDIVIGGRWYENGGDLAAGPWAERVFTSAWKHADCTVEVGDFNADGRPDVVLAPAEYQGGTYRIAWYEAPADPRSSDWPEHAIVDSIETVVHGIAVADMDLDGAFDLVAARMHQGKSPQEVAAYLNREKGNAWTKVVASARGSHNIALADFNGDGRMDILGANHGGPYQPLEVWLNTRPAPAAGSGQPETPSGSAR